MKISVVSEAKQNLFSEFNFITFYWKMLAFLVTVQLIFQNVRLNNGSYLSNNLSISTALGLLVYQNTNSLFLAITSGLIEYLPDVFAQDRAIITSDPFAMLNIDKLNSIQSLFIPGFMPGIGGTLASLGDWNQDGLDDWFISSNEANYPNKTLGYIIYNPNQRNGNFPLANITSTQGFKIIQNIANTPGSRAEIMARNVGDINQDGMPDLLLSTNIYDTNSRTNNATVYLIFGKDKRNTNLYLNNFTTSDGVIIQLLFAAGIDVLNIAKAGDVNCDGISDFILGGAENNYLGLQGAGTTYLVYGKNNFSGSINLNNLSPQEGVIIYGSKDGEGIGYTVTGVDDINGDQCGDVVISATTAIRGSNPGAVFIVFGSNALPHIFALNNMSGVSYVEVLSGTFSYIGGALAGISDFNGDKLNDLVIGSPQASVGNVLTYFGSLFILFGRMKFPQQILLNQLDNNTGVEIRGIGDRSSSFHDMSIQSNIDINADGLSDLVVGSSKSIPFGIILAGMVTIIFGDRNFPAVFEIDQLTAKQGYIISGNQEQNQIGTTISVSQGFKGQHHVLIGAPFYTPTPGFPFGAVYVVTLSKHILFQPEFNVTATKKYDEDKPYSFNIVPNLIFSANNLSLKIASSLINVGEVIMEGFNLTSLNNNSWQTIGAFQLLANSLRNLQFKPTHDFNENFTFTLTLISDSSVTEAYTVEMQGIPSNDQPYIRNNQIELTANQTLLINRGNLLAGDPEDTGTLFEKKLLFLIQNSSYVSIFNKSDASKTILQQFLQSDIDSNNIAIFSSSNSRTFSFPTFYFKIRDQAGLESEIYRSNIAYYLIPMIVNNQLSVPVAGATVTLTSSNLYVSYGQDNADQLQITISNVRGGYFNLGNQNQTPPFNFLQKIIGMGQLSFIHDGSDQSPIYDVSATDGRQMTELVRVKTTAPFTKNQPPFLQNNYLTIQEGQLITINRTELLADDDTQDASAIEYLIDEATLVHLSFINKFIQINNTLRFKQIDVDRGRIDLQHDGSDSAPKVRFRLSDSDVISNYYDLNITLIANMNDPPTVSVKEWLIEQGKKQILSTREWQASDPDNSPEDLIYTITKLTHGEFHTAGMTNSISMFTQAQIDAGEIEFEHDNSDQSPEIEYSVSDGKLQTMIQMVPIKFIQNANSANSTLIGGTVAAVVGGLGLFGGGFLYFRKKQADKSREGNDLNIMTARKVYERLKIAGVSHFKSEAGLLYVQQIGDINQTYQANHAIANPDEYITALVSAIRETLNGEGVSESCNSLKLNVLPGQRQPLVRQNELIAQRCYEILIANQSNNFTESSSHVEMKNLGNTL